VAHQSHFSLTLVELVRPLRPIEIISHGPKIRFKSKFNHYKSSNSTTNQDSQTTIFSPEGRLYQVEYALEAISHAGTALGILAQDGIVLAAERKVTSKLLEQDTSAEKLYILNEYASQLERNDQC
jgi:hypothetical protein